MRILGCFFLLVFSMELGAQPVEFSFSPSTASGAFIGQVQVDGGPAEAGSWIAAFGPDGNCAGANELILFAGLSYANLSIYGDDPNTENVDEGLAPGDYFTLRLFLPSSGNIIEYTSEGMPVQLEGWVNTNGAPMPDYGDETAVYDFLTTGPALAYTYFYSAPNCYNSADGQVSLMVSGGLPPYSYSWNTGDEESQLQNLPAGIYQCTITDAGGQELATDLITLDAPPILSLILRTEIDSCGAGTGVATASALGGTPPYDFSWNDGQSTGTISQLEAGSYSVTATDENGCEVMETAEVTSSPPFSASTSTTGASCNGAADAGAILSVEGESAPYMYQWSNGSTGPELMEVTAGAYAYTITDAYGCLQTATVELQEPAALSLQLQSSPALNEEASGTASVTASGGTPPYSYAWNDDSQQQSMEANGLTPGEYTVTVTDDKGCTQTGTVVVDMTTGSSGPSLHRPQVSLFPNPLAGDVAYLKKEGKYEETTEVWIRSLNGTSVRRMAIRPGEQSELWLGGLAPGIYLLGFPELPGSAAMLLIKI